MGRDTNDWVQDDYGRVFRWPFCVVGGCPNRVCTGRSDKFCWPHSSGGESVTEMIAKHKTLVPSPS